MRVYVLARKVAIHPWDGLGMPVTSSEAEFLALFTKEGTSCKLLFKCTY
jgi:hypothetical protein